MVKLGNVIKFNNYYQLLLMVQYYKSYDSFYAVYEFCREIVETSDDCIKWSYYVMKKLDIQKVGYCRKN